MTASQVFSGNGDPNGVVVGNPGDAYQDQVGKLWVNTAAPSTWVQLGPALALVAPITIVVGAAPSAGVAASLVRSDHQHGIPAGVAPSALAVGGVSAEGVSGSVARADHVHGLPAPAVPVDVTKTAASAGAATAVARADHKHDVATSVPVAVTVGAAAAEGGSASLSRADHQHGVPAGVAPTVIAVGAAAAEGASTSVARADHVHGLPAPVAPVDVMKAAAAAGVALTVARADHKHDVVTAVPITVVSGTAPLEGASAALARADHQHGLLTLAPSTPAVPLTDVVPFARLRAGRTMLSQIAPLGRAYELQPALFANKAALWTAQGNGTTITLINFGNSTTGTASTRNVVVGTFSTQLRRLAYQSANAMGSLCGTRHNALQFWRGNGANLGGFFYVTRFVIDTPVLNMRWFVGLLGSAAAIGGVNPSALTNIVGFGIDMGQTTVRFFNNDNAGVATATDLGAAFPATTAGVVYEARIFCAPNGATIFYSLERLDVAALVDGSAAADIPSAVTLLSPQIWMMNDSGLAGAVAVGVISQYIETDF